MSTATLTQTQFPFELFDATGSGRWYQDFDDIDDARSFAERARAMFGAVAEFEQRNTRVYITEVAE
jgi:hypothetical protein